ncbi:uncharacterized protein LOC124489856 [Dermatophagoides farinae]|uniref:Uncharacterized protein n=1 Tax=Dermatophagoides farinae TaxID=6954 RepID=A0A922I6V4_DERFA|nr:uncharacterized protein LOC124489856 [Dermatophagoides farinae]KAH9521790.1 hypothetical protein DERF_005420 [Dermatophagoides farinae]
MLDFLKKQIQAMMPSEYWIALVDKYWNTFAVMIVMAPIIWLHFTRIMAFSDWNHYNCLAKCMFIVYLVFVYIVHELLRIIVVKIINKELTVTELMASMKQCFMATKQFIIEHPFVVCIIDKLKRIRSQSNDMMESITKTATVTSIDKQK